MAFRVAVAISGRGSNLAALHAALRASGGAEVALVLSDRAEAPGLAWAGAQGLRTHPLARPADGGEWQAALAGAGADLLVLAGYRRLVPADVISAYRDRIVNIHPSLLPAFGGRGMYGDRVHAAVLAAGVPETGCTVHLVTERYDEGAVLAQARVPVRPEDTPASLAARVLAAEHHLLPAVVLAAARVGRPVPLEGGACRAR